MFLTLHRIVVFIFLYLIASGYLQTSLSYRGFLVVEYFTLFLALLFGAWYGIWIGLHWFKKVYEERVHIGYLDHLNSQLFPDDNEKLMLLLERAKERLQADAEQVEELEEVVIEKTEPSAPVIVEETIITPVIVESAPKASVKPKKKKATRKKTVKRKTVS